ncbi:MAG: hypothetical protein M0Z36_02150 [Thermaerobacter sp.]|nr:hypothetical protein [Thermaerobacter sp.]
MAGLLIDDKPVPTVARIDRAMQDVEAAVALIAQCEPPLADDAHSELFRQRLARAVNLLCSADRDIAVLKDELFITHGPYDADCLRQREYLPFEPQPMFQVNTDNTRFFAGGGGGHVGPMTIQEHLHRYSSAICGAAQSAAMALLVDEADMRQDPAAGSHGWTDYQLHLLNATAFVDEEEGHDLQAVRAIIAPNAKPLRVSVYVTTSDVNYTRASGKLQDAGIHFWLRTVSSRAGTGTPNGRMTTYEIFVRRDNEPEAKAALDSD